MNTKIYKKVHELATNLMEAARKEDQEQFDQLYSELKGLCKENEGSDKDHPVQWETLADFTEDLEGAVIIYQKALVLAEDIGSGDFGSSIGFSIATLQLELGQKDAALASLEKARLACLDIEDKELKAEIHDLLTELKSQSQ